VDRARWRNRIALPTLLATALVLTAIAPPAFSAGVRVPGPPAPQCGAVSPAGAAKAALGPSNARARGARAQSQLGNRGELTGRVLMIPGSAGPAMSITLPVESSVTPATGSLVLYTRHTQAGGSEVRALNVGDGCDVQLAAPAEIVRGAVLDPTATAVYVHSVTRADRADAGVTRHDLVTGVASLVVPPFRPSEDFGPIFGTELRWSVAGDSLAAQSCGFVECLTRVLNPAGQLATYGASGQGQFIGLTRGHLITFGSCPGLPCEVLSADLQSGDVTVLAVEGFAASLTPTIGGDARLQIQTANGTVEIEQ
jgi:hypothetical protein